MTEPGPDVLGWCASRLGAIDGVEPVAEQMSQVFLVRLKDGRQVVLKVRDDPDGRAVACLDIQRRVFAAGLPCPEPLTGLGRLGQQSVHVEAWRPGGELLLGDTAEVAELSAQLLADVMDALGNFDHQILPLPNPDWVRWDYQGPGDWPPHRWIDHAPNQSALPDYLENAACRARARLSLTTLPKVVGHGDWETQNLRWLDQRPFVIHDWDSAVYLPEAAIVGAASGAFASNMTPTLADIDSSRVFLDAYQAHRRRAFSAEESEVAWAASLWPAIHNARTEFRFDQIPVAGAALKAQAEHRLRLAGA